MTRRRKPVRLGQRLTRRELNACNQILLANEVGVLIPAGRKLPIVADLVRSLSGLSMTRAADVLHELTAALDGAGKAEHTS